MINKYNEVRAKLDEFYASVIEQSAAAARLKLWVKVLTVTNVITLLTSIITFLLRR
jgi:hypothetical protein